MSFIEELRHLFILMLKSPRRSINPDRAIKKFKNTRKLCGVDFSHEVALILARATPLDRVFVLGLFRICDTSDRSG